MPTPEPQSNPSPFRRVATTFSPRLAWLALALLTAIAAYGFIAEEVFALRAWDRVGAPNFLIYSAAFWTPALVILRLRPGWLAPLLGGIMLLYTGWWSGPMAPLAVLYFLGSCYFLGRALYFALTRFLTSPNSAEHIPGVPIAILLGAAAWMLLLWTALHFPVNYSWTYLVAFAIPYLVYLTGTLRLPALQNPPPAHQRLLFPSDRITASTLAILLFLLLAHWLVALKPEISGDGLSMHLALPAWVASHGSWDFDFLQYTWALMPAGADTLYTAVFVLAGESAPAMGGEAAARLLNWAFLAITAALIASAARQWAAAHHSLLAAALFVSTPLVMLVTGSLFVENVWTAFSVAATLTALRYGFPREGFRDGAGNSHARADIVIAAIFLGAAMATKLIAGAFLLPLALIAAPTVIRRRDALPFLVAAALLALFAAPTYLYAWVVSGNPVFPFMNAVFQSPAYYSADNFTDVRFASIRPAWDTLYQITFRSNIYMESQGGGAAGFQYFLLLIPAAILARGARQWAVLGTAVLSAVTILIASPNLRYLYPSLALASIALVWTASKAPARLANAAALILIAMNLYYLPAAGPYDRDFAILSPSQIEPYLEGKAPVRFLIEHLNRVAPGEPVAFFATDGTAGLLGPAFAESWHTETVFWLPVRSAPDPAAIAAIFRDLGIRHVIAPESRAGTFATVGQFLKLWLDPDGPVHGSLGVFRLRDEGLRRDARPLTPGRYEDPEERIEYSGDWLHDPNWPDASAGSITYSGQPGDTLRVRFNGSGIRYVYTRAFNRGIAEVLIDEGPAAPIDLYSPELDWQNSTTFDGLAAGLHSIEIRVTGTANPAAQDRFVDLDALEVLP